MDKIKEERINIFPLTYLIVTNALYFPLSIICIIFSISYFQVKYFLSILLFVLITIILLNYIQLEIYGRSTPWKIEFLNNSIEIKYFTLKRKIKTINIKEVKNIDATRMRLSTRYNIALIYQTKIIFLHNLSRKDVEIFVKRWPSKVINTKPIYPGHLGIFYKDHIYKKYGINQKSDKTW